MFVQGEKNLMFEFSNYKEKIFLTFDFDWVVDGVLEYLLNLLEEENVKATFFVTHQTELLERIRANKNFELGIHPNFNFLLKGNFQKNHLEIIDEILDIVPEAVSVRSHSLFQSSTILNDFKKRNIKIDANLYIPFNSGMNIGPFLNWDHLIRIPHFWEDDIHFTDIANQVYSDWAVDRFLEFNSLKVFDFHPIHVFLNTDSKERYELAKKDYKNISHLKKNVNQERSGVFTFLRSLIKKAKRGHFEFCCLKDVLSEVNYDSAE